MRYLSQSLTIAYLAWTGAQGMVFIRLPHELEAYRCFCDSLVYG